MLKHCWELFVVTDDQYTDNTTAYAYTREDISRQPQTPPMTNEEA